MNWTKGSLQRRSSAGRAAARDYFDGDEDVEAEPPQPPPTSSLSAPPSEDFDDPLDAFMAGVNEQAVRDRATIGQSLARQEVVSHVDEQDEDEAGLQAVRRGQESEGEESEVEVDEEGMKRGRIEPLPPVDHSQAHYPPFKKAFYKESAATRALSEEEVAQLRRGLELQVSPPSAPRPVQGLRDLGLDQRLLDEILRLGLEKPTAIQAQAVPALLCGRDVLGLARTGSGKTFAYLWPLLTHIMHQPQMSLGDGPIALVLVPTRELAAQISGECKRFSRLYGIRTGVVYGGAGKWEMTKVLKNEAPEVVIATPGRFIEMVRIKATNLRRCSFVVLDEADRMFELGFEYQMRSVVQNVRPDRQLVMFSATMRKRVEGFAREIFNDEVRIVVGSVGQASGDIQQRFVFSADDMDKWVWLGSNVDDFASQGKVLIFVPSKAGCEELALKLRAYFASRALDIGVDCLHGDKDQAERSIIMQRFCKTSDLPILIATDIAARGLDVKDIRTVINFEPPRQIETYVHRIGRTGRMGLQGVQPGVAYSLLTSKDSSFAVDLVHNLRLSAQAVPADLLQLASKDVRWHRQGKGGQGRGGLGTGGAKAMTSEMLAKETNNSHTGSSGRKNIISSMNNNSTTMNRSTVNSKKEQEFSGKASIPGFVASSSSYATSSPGTAVKGFVRASTSYHSVTASGNLEGKSDTVPYSTVSSITSNNTLHADNGNVTASVPRKRSRWDT